MSDRGAGPRDLDVVGGPTPRASAGRRSATLLVLAVLVFGLGVGVGYQVRNRPEPTPLPAPTSARPAVPISATAARCSVQSGTRLQLGVEVIDRGGPAVLMSVRVEVPLGGLRLVAAQWGACGQLSAPPAGGDRDIAAGATAWVSATFDVLVACPEPLPVSFLLTYADEDGAVSETDVGGFNDLGDVPYTGCATSGGPG